MHLSETQELQLNHRSVRRYRDQPLEPGQLELLIRCGQAAATSSFIQAYSVVRVTRSEARAASGIAAAFNAPVAGALFSVEIILGDFGVAQFSPIVISSVIATVVSRHFLGDFPAFEVPEYHLVSPLELIPYAVLGLLALLVVLGGVAAVPIAGSGRRCGC